MNGTIRQLMRKRNKTHYKAKITNNPQHWHSYRHLRNRVIDEIRKARENYNKKISSLIDKSIPPGKWWRIIKSISKLNKNFEPMPPLRSDGNLIFHPVEKASLLNKYFAQVSSITNEPDGPLHEPGPPSFNNENLLELFITEEEVGDQLCIINSSKPLRPDGISPRILKGISSSIKKPLTKLFNTSLRLRKLPDLWKIAQITPIFKNKGSAQQAANYRPISLTSSLCKLMEKILFKHLHNYMIDNNIIYKYQSGFQPGDSTLNQLVEIYNTIISSLDKGKDIRFIFVTSLRHLIKFGIMAL